jgi:hypothetical protein
MHVFCFLFLKMGENLDPQGAHHPPASWVFAFSLERERLLASNINPQLTGILVCP